MRDTHTQQNALLAELNLPETRTCYGRPQSSEMGEAGPAGGETCCPPPEIERRAVSAATGC